MKRYKKDIDEFRSVDDYLAYRNEEDRQREQFYGMIGLVLILVPAIFFSI